MDSSEPNYQKVRIILLATIGVKCLLLIFFSSGYKDQLFIPFISIFLDDLGNPWVDAQGELSGNSFPYPPLMLYLMSFFIGIGQFLGEPDSVIESLFYGMPLLLSDILIFYTLIKFFPWRKTEIYIFYFSSPIVLYSTYMHGQLDIIPTALLFYSLYLLTSRKTLQSAILVGIAACTKFHVITAIPLMIIYLMGKGDIKGIIYLIALPVLTYLFVTFPYLGGEAYQQAVLLNEKQGLIFNTSFSIGDSQIYLPVLAVAIIYLRFLSFQKINNDLLFSMTGALFSVFLLLIEAAPAWFVWVLPFFTTFYIRYFSGYQHYLYYSALVVIYLTYYLLFYPYDFTQLTFIGYDISMTVVPPLPEYQNLVFTLLKAVLLASTFHIYKSGIKSNQVYTMEQPFVLGISGDSGTGKTTLLRGLEGILGNDLLKLEGDGDHKWERGNEKWEKITHLNPKANFLHSQTESISELKRRNSIKRVDYMHDTGKFSKEEKVKPRNFIVIAGLHALYLPKMRKVIDLKIYLDMDENLRVHWKIIRDVNKRGHTIDKVLSSIDARMPDAKKYIYPQKQFADLIIKFFPLQKINQNSNQNIELGLELTFDASIATEAIVSYFKSEDIALEWNYSENLKTQVLRFNKEPDHLNYEKIANRFIDNVNELLEQPKWEPGYKGLLQFLTLLIISDILREKANKNA